MHKLTKEQFIEASLKKHGNKFIYNLLPNSMNKADKVIICCKDHGNFNQDYLSHIKSNFCCPKCACEATHKKQRKTLLDFIDQAKKVHGAYYDYSKVDYKKNIKNVIIICPIHGEFNQMPSNHLRCQKQLACLKCSDIDKGKRKAFNSSLLFIEKAIEVHGNKYDYSKVKYNSATDKVIIVCPKHGEFLQRPAEHFSYGCFKCGIESVKEKTTHTKEFILNKFKEIHGDRYDYSLVEYTGYNDKVNIICKSHGIFAQAPASHISNESNCPKCYSKGSKGETELQEFVNTICINSVNNNKELIGPKELDIVIPDKKIAIEFNGLYWHTEELLGSKHYHLNKTQLCAKEGYELIHVWEDSWNLKKEILKSFLKARLGFVDKVIYGRKTKLMEIDYEDVKGFLNKNHIQGSAKGSIYLGLFYENELVSASVFSIHKGYFQLERHACLLNTKVFGALGKVIKYVDRVYLVKIVTFCDISMFTGKSYEAVGFKVDKILPPDYSYLVNGRREHKFNFRKKVFANKYGLDIEGKTEEDLRKELGLEKIYDCGKIRYIYEPKEIQT